MAKPGDTFLIVTEGEITEPVYFDLLLSDLQLSTVQVRVLPGDTSDPRRVVETASWLAREQERKHRKGILGSNEPGKFDHVWAVIDTDVAIREQFWPKVEALARAKKIKLAHSTPCFEFWLLLHVVGFTTRSDLYNGDMAKAALERELGKQYSTNEETAKAAIALFFREWPGAVAYSERVRLHHAEVGTPAPGNPSTEVDCLVRALNDSAREHLRKLVQSKS
ncbi:MAG TPA: RloB family protein [Candidatus Limnocylindria bacterium]|nr:RloB family protein [Candidatus Limnocylindria bacterium]